MIVYRTKTDGLFIIISKNSAINFNNSRLSIWSERGLNYYDYYTNVNKIEGKRKIVATLNFEKLLAARGQKFPRFLVDLIFNFKGVIE